MWMQEVTSRFLVDVYQRLDPVQKEVVLAFSVYRKPVTLKAAQAIIMNDFSREQLLLALPKLMRHNLFLNLSETGFYQLQAVVANFAQSHFGDTSNQTDPKKLQEAHSHAAFYYQSLIKRHLSLEPYRNRTDLLIEMAWHLYNAGEDQNACDLIRQEDLLKYLL